MIIKTSDIKKLRDETGVSIIKCKKALEEALGDAEKAKVILQQKSKEVVQKKKNRELGAGRIASYVHSNKTVGAIVELSCETDFVAKNESFVELAYNIAMHIVAMNPDYTNISDIPEKEKDIIKEVIEEEFSDKPDKVREKAVKSKLASALSEKTLMEQRYIKDGGKTISNLIEEAVQKFGERIEVSRFKRFEVGY